jgi:CRP-like cAMP-binding protein
MSEITDKIESYLQSYPIRTFATGEMVLFAHEDPREIFYIVSGKVNMYDVSAKGNEVVINVYEPGRFFPLGWALNKTANKYFYKAEADSIFRLIPTQKLVEFISKNADVSLELLRVVHQSADRLFDRMVYLTSASAARRLVYELTVECRRFGKLQSDGSYVVAVREMDLASRSGLSRETVSREFQKLKESGCVRLEKRSIRVSDLAKLEAMVGAVR